VRDKRFCGSEEHSDWLWDPPPQPPPTPPPPPCSRDLPEKLKGPQLLK